MARPGSRSFRDRLAVRGVQLGFVAFVLLLWYAATYNGHINPLLLPPLTGVASEFVKVVAAGEFWDAIRITVTELISAFLLALAMGSVVGYFASRTRFRLRVFDPLLSGLYAVPGIVIYPLYLLFFGLGSGSKIAIGATIAFFPMVLNTMTAFGTVDGSLLRAAHSMGASRLHLFWYVLLPAAFPGIIVGIRMSFIISFLVIIGAEVLSSLGGLGHEIVDNAESMNMTIMFSYIVFVILIALALNGLISSIEARWRPR